LTMRQALREGKKFFFQNIRSLKAFVFDLDGTLINTFEVYLHSLNEGLKAFGLPPISSKKLTEFLNQATPLEEILKRVAPSKFTDTRTRLSCVEKIKKAYFSALEKVKLLNGAPELLFTLKDKGFKVGIVTGRTTRGEEKWLELKRLGIAEFVDVFVTGFEAPRKPSSGGIRTCIKELGVSPEEAILVGDSEADALASKEAGIPFIGVATGVGKKQKLLALGALYVFQDLRELLKMVKRLDTFNPLE